VKNFNFEASRRSFAKQIGLATAGTAAFMTNMQAQSTITDADILQFALNLEYLEAEFYTYARTGKGIDSMGIGVDGSGVPGPTTGGQKVTFFDNSSLAMSADQIGSDERAHVAFLRKTLTSLGVQPVARPAINLNALSSGFESPEAFIALARAFEDVGVSAYGGAAPLIQDKTILGYAARILATEGEHVGNLRLHAALYQAQTKPLDAADIIPPPAGTRYISVNADGLTAIRTPGQVLNIVYGGQSGVSAGGFFPTGMNGNLKTSTAAAAAF
jgi:hypothetical protein